MKAGLGLGSVLLHAEINCPFVQQSIGLGTHHEGATTDSPDQRLVLWRLPCNRLGKFRRVSPDNGET
jgi:hypothetical protein